MADKMPIPRETPWWHEPAGVIAFVIVLCLPVLAVYGLVWLWNAV